MKDSLGLKTATLEFYESVNDGGVDKGELLSIFVPGVHNESFNNLEQFWTVSTTDPDPYPYAGKSNVNRGSDTGETNTPAPAGVRDLQLTHRRTIISSLLLQSAGSGSYSVYNLGSATPSILPLTGMAPMPSMLPRSPGQSRESPVPASLRSLPVQERSRVIRMHPSTTRLPPPTIPAIWRVGLPSGLSLNTRSGLISGIPTAAALSARPSPPPMPLAPQPKCFR